MSENDETEIDVFGTNLLCEKHSEVFEGIALFFCLFFVKISKTIKANGFHIFLRLGHHFVRALWCFLQ